MCSDSCSEKWQSFLKLYHLQILTGVENLRLGNFEMFLCFSDFEHAIANLISFETRKIVWDYFVLWLLENGCLEVNFPKVLVHI